MERFNSRNVGATALALLTTLAGTPDALAKGKAQEKPASPEALLVRCEASLEQTRELTNACLGTVLGLAYEINDIKKVHPAPVFPAGRYNSRGTDSFIQTSSMAECTKQSADVSELATCVESHAIYPMTPEETEEYRKNQDQGGALVFNFSTSDRKLDASGELDVCLQSLEEAKGEQAIVDTAKARLTTELARLKRAQTAEREQRTRDQASRLKAMQGNRDAR